MAYTNPGWPVNIPAGSDAISSGDDQIRRLRLDLLERFNALVSDVTLDPIVTVTGLKRRIPWEAGSCIYRSNDWSPTLTGVGPTVISTAVDWTVPLPFDMNGATVTSLAVVVYRDAGATITAEPFTGDDAGAELSLGGNVVSGATGFHTLALGTAPFVVDMTTKAYRLRCHLVANGALSTSARLLHWIVTYTLPYALRSI